MDLSLLLCIVMIYHIPVLLSLEVFVLTCVWPHLGVR